ncbi:HAMP domain-containing sensor histidine kinase [Brevibacillus laterosporus]|uniref:HAMP domain-containing sensor histidine kinase n=1 Tax=Brevibacillus laterosporus TaxID=1465 RepID=UPI000839C48D|nr:ATP-binding protein [Brevibacillus laterosporus]
MYGIKKRLVMNFTFVVLMVILVLGSSFVIGVRSFYYGGAEQALLSRINVSTNFYNKYIQYYNLQSKAKYIFEHTSQDDLAHVEVIDLDGNVILDFNGFTKRKSVLTQDVQDALKGDTGIWVGKSEDTGEHILAVSKPLTFYNSTAGVLRYVTSVEEIDKVVNQITLLVWSIGAGLVLLSLVLNLILSKRIISPIVELTGAAKSMAKGDFSQRARQAADDEIGTLAETFNYMASELEKAEEIKNDFISSVSHELRTPLTSIKGWSEVVLTGDMEDKEETRLAMQIIVKETDRLTGLVEQLLDFSRLQAGGMEIHKTELEVNQLLMDVQQQFSARAFQKEIKLVTETPDEPLRVLGDENRLKQVVINLLHNSMKFSEEHTTITIRSYQEDQVVIIEVIDQGAGISEEELPRITDRFYKGKHKQSGSGIGLSLCLEIVKLHQGTLHVTSKVGVGTTIQVCLPIYEQ